MLLFTKAVLTAVIDIVIPGPTYAGTSKGHQYLLPLRAPLINTSLVFMIILYGHCRAYVTGKSALVLLGIPDV